MSVVLNHPFCREVSSVSIIHIFIGLVMGLAYSENELRSTRSLMEPLAPLRSEG